MKKSKGLNLGDLQGMAIALVVLILIIFLGIKVVDQVQDTADQSVGDVTCGTYSNETCTAGDMTYNTSQSGLEALDLFGDWYDILVIVVIAVVVIGLLVSYFQRM